MEISNFGSPEPKKVFFENVCMQYRAQLYHQTTECMGRNLYMRNYFEYQPHYFVFYQPPPPKLLIIKKLKIVLIQFVLKMGLGVLYVYSLLLKICSLTSVCYPVKVEDNNQFVNKIVYCTSLNSSRLPSVVIGDRLSRCLTKSYLHVN